MPNSEQLGEDTAARDGELQLDKTESGYLARIADRERQQLQSKLKPFKLQQSTPNFQLCKQWALSD